MPRLLVSTVAAAALLVPAVCASADDAVDLSCAWSTLSRKCSMRRKTPSLRLRGKLDVACDGGASPRVSVALYASPDSSVAPGAIPLAAKRVRPRSGRAVRVRFDAPLPFGAPARYVVARVDDGAAVAEGDESNNLAVAGPLSTGEEYFPLEPGNQARYAGTAQPPLGGPVDYTRARCDEGDHEVAGGVLAQAVSSRDSITGEVTLEYLQRDAQGVVMWGNEDPEDEITNQIAPFRVLLFPFDSPYGFTAVSRRGLRLGEDADHDGRQERLDLKQRVEFLGFEDVDLPVARFDACAHVRTIGTGTVTLSRSGMRVRVSSTQDQWLAPGFGPVRVVEKVKGPGIRSSSEETLTGAATDSAGCGVVDRVTFAPVTFTDLAGFDARPAAASDGATTLLAAVRASADGDPHGLIGVFLAANGRAFRQVQIADFPVASDLATPAVAFGAGRFVVAWRRTGEPLRLRAVAADGTFPWGGATLDLPVLCEPDGAFRVAFDGAAFVVLAAGRDAASSEPTVSVFRVGPEGSLLGAAELAADLAPGGVAAAWDGESTLCVWSAETELRAARVSAAGAVLDLAPIRFAVGVETKSHPAVASSPGGGWLVAWTHSQLWGPSRVRRCLVSREGTASPSEGAEIPSLVYREGDPEVALDGAEFLLVAHTGSEGDVRAVRLTLGGDEVPAAESGLPSDFGRHEWDDVYHAPIVVRVGDRALCAWHRTPTTDGVPPAVVGALVFPRRAAGAVPARAAR